MILKEKREGKRRRDREKVERSPKEEEENIQGFERRKKDGKNNKMREPYLGVKD